MNPVAKRVLELLALSVGEFETVIRRRRFGFQSFLTPEALLALPSTPSAACSVCSKKFVFFRSEYNCELCGRAVCRGCIRSVSVEHRVGAIYSRHCCIQCISRVDACTFEDEDLKCALGPVVVDADTTDVDAWLESVEMIHNTPSKDRNRTLVPLPTAQPLTPERPSLHQLAKLVHHHTAPGEIPSASSVLGGVEKHAVSSLRRQFHEQPPKASDCVVYDRQHDYAFAFDSEKTSSPMAPVAPVADPIVEHRRLACVDATGVLSATYDHAALDVLAEAAARTIGCPMGFVSVIDSDNFHTVGRYQLPPIPGRLMTRESSLCQHNVYAQAPLILTDPRRDQRFAQLPVVSRVGVKFYAGFPIHHPKQPDVVLASLCAADVQPRGPLTTAQYATMKVLSELAAEVLITPVQDATVKRDLTFHHDDSEQILRPASTVDTTR